MIGQIWGRARLTVTYEDGLKQSIHYYVIKPAEKAYPFGSEMAWDSTGQEEVFAWCKYFGADEKAEVSLNSILGYMPTVPHWGYNGNARRYWDFLYGGKLRRIERQLHHYGSGLNAIPVLSEYRENPDDFPSKLDWDAYSGDYESNKLPKLTALADSISKGTWKKSVEPMSFPWIPA